MMLLWVSLWRAIRDFENRVREPLLEAIVILKLLEELGVVREQVRHDFS